MFHYQCSVTDKPNIPSLRIPTSGCKRLVVIIVNGFPLILNAKGRNIRRQSHIALLCACRDQWPENHISNKLFTLEQLIIMLFLPSSPSVLIVCIQTYLVPRRFRIRCAWLLRGRARGRRTENSASSVLSPHAPTQLHAVATCKVTASKKAPRYDAAYKQQLQTTCLSLQMGMTRNIMKTDLYLKYHVFFGED